MDQNETTPQQKSGITNYFQGATIHNLVINGNMTKSGDEHYHYQQKNTEKPSYTDAQIAQALQNNVGDGKAIDAKWKWAGAYWLLRWLCNFPLKPTDFCERVNKLPFTTSLKYTCDYRNIRELTTLSFMNEDPTQLDLVRYSKNDETQYKALSHVVRTLSAELSSIITLKEAI